MVLLVLNDELEHEDLELLIKTCRINEVAVVLANVLYDDESVLSVNIDYEKASYQITKLMIEQGRKDIYYVIDSKNI